MKKLMLSVLIGGAILLPAKDVKDAETMRGYNELAAQAATKIADASARNSGHAFLSMKGYNLAQQYMLQRDLESKGYVVDISPFSFWVGW